MQRASYLNYKNKCGTYAANKGFFFMQDIAKRFQNGPTLTSSEIRVDGKYATKVQYPENSASLPGLSAFDSLVISVRSENSAGPSPWANLTITQEGEGKINSLILIQPYILHPIWP